MSDDVKCPKCKGPCEEIIYFERIESDEITPSHDVEVKTHRSTHDELLAAALKEQDARASDHFATVIQGIKKDHEAKMAAACGERQALEARITELGNLVNYWRHTVGDVRQKRITTLQHERDNAAKFAQQMAEVAKKLEEEKAALGIEFSDLHVLITQYETVVEAVGYWILSEDPAAGSKLITVYDECKKESE